MSELTLIIMAAGMGSRYGGLKQIDPVDEYGHIIMDFSIYDAKAAGFDKVIFVIKEENLRDFKEAIGDRVSKTMKTAYVFQRPDDLPKGYSVPEGRSKPWGTGHALLCCREETEGSCAVINADDYYGPEAFRIIADYLRKNADEPGLYHYAMAGFQLMNTLTDHGYVSRGICTVDSDDNLTGITERTHIEKRNGGASYTEDEGLTWNVIREDSVVSMNMWGFSHSIFTELSRCFPDFLDDVLIKNPLKGEYFLPSVVNILVNKNKAAVKVLRTPDRWYGVTYKEDKPVVCAAIKKMEDEGRYAIPAEST